jgi:hypothetical protein
MTHEPSAALAEIRKRPDFLMPQLPNRSSFGQVIGYDIQRTCG